MAEGREPRPSTDEENAPLLQDSGQAPGADGHAQHPKSFIDHINDITQEPLTPLTKILLGLVLVLLLLTSIFIGLFAGAEHKLKSRRDPRESPITTIISATATITTTESLTQTIPTGPAPTEIPAERFCTTPACVVVASSIISGLDTSQDPCDNFYDFANGGWLDKNEIPVGRGTFGSFEKLAAENKLIIRKILSGTASTESEYDRENLKKLRDLYASCTNEDLLNEIGQSSLLSFVKIIKDLYRSDESKGTDETSAPTNGLTAALSFLHSRGIDGLFSFGVDGDVGVDPNQMTLWFYQPDLGLPAKEYFADEDIKQLYQDTLEKIIYALDDEHDEEKIKLTTQDSSDAGELTWPPWPWPPWGDDDDDKKPPSKSEWAKEAAEGVVEFEYRIANASLDLEDLYGDPFGTYNPTAFGHFAMQLPQINFPIYFSSFTPRNFPNTIIEASTTYTASLSNILSNTTSEIIETYLVTRAALKLAPYLGSTTDVWKAHRTLIETLQGIKKGQVPDRSEWCVTQVESLLGFSAGRFFVEQTFGGDSKEKGTKVITDIIDAFKDSLPNLDWMDKESAAAAAEKADAIRVKVGYPLSPNTTSARSIATYYYLVHINEEKLLENVLQAWASEEYKKWQKLGKKRDLEEWEMWPSMVNAYFNPPANEIVFPAGILRPPFFSKDWPAYLRYGAFGQVAAHELTHAFDSSGRLYNQNGKLEQWWTNATSDGFNKIQKCIVDQYSGYTIDDGKGGKIHVNGNLTSGENIGDSGLIQSYRAWRGQFHTSLEEGNELLLPGLNYTQEQLFFIAFGQIWAQSIKPQAAVQRVLTDPHSPNRYRVDGTLSNIPEFAAAFNCPVGSKLNPPDKERCLFWS